MHVCACLRERHMCVLDEGGGTCVLLLQRCEWMREGCLVRREPSFVRLQREWMNERGREEAGIGYAAGSAARGQATGRERGH